MQDFFDSQQKTLASYLAAPEENTVNHFTGKVFGFASGGLADSSDTTDNTLGSSDTGPSTSLLQRLINSAQKSFTSSNSSAFGGQYGSSPLGMGFYNSPAYLAARFTDLGRFFTGAEPGNFYTNRYEQPQKTPALKSEDPAAYYSRWYERMRNFAQAEEVANRGQTQVRGA